VVRDPVRGGQQVVAPDGDLVVTATVGNGAEIAAAGHVHVYGTLRGRAFAGIEGDEAAMIFCDQLEAELLSIAGVHLVNEEIDPRLLGRRARVRLERERLVVQPAG
jgi:septum site-determining protein MinC